MEQTNISPSMNDTFSLVKSKMKKHREFYERNETATRTQIVEPVLRALGWDTENPEEVRPDYSTDEGRPDYTLLQHGKKHLFVEVKKLSVDIERKEILRQLAHYCFGEGMRYGLLTNGAVWVLFKAFQEGTHFAQRIVWKTDLQTDGVTEVLRKLKTISKNNIHNIDIVLKKESLLDEVWRFLLKEPDQLAEGLVPLVKRILSERHPNYTFHENEVKDFVKNRVIDVLSSKEEKKEMPPAVPDFGRWKEAITAGAAKKPVRMTISGKSYPLRYAKEILVNTAEWLIQQGKLKRNTPPISSGRTRYIFNDSPRHPRGNHFRAPERLSNGLYIETHASVETCKSNARKLLERLVGNGELLKFEY